ncbi:hypothetical protein [Ancylobacter defluvii]|uniref:Uncharacterized protein n=1 Tax=Ancylobacter defluvii TaxID=1282440 RepID=A0A9W6K0S4_9HYPH|nr:hypothetical protein [Ancylobacter defluvii]MBS7588407.1 hypothetical protein [Ancylobacter defluvii]GLK86812.1 hypothetical protein GCM10017653_48820 [Ancylobacter defluvii]
MSTSTPDGNLIREIGVIETTQSDNILRWDGEELYVEQDIYHNGQLVHRKYKRRVTRSVAQALATLLHQH